jgi:hypothetical protein
MPLKNNARVAAAKFQESEWALNYGLQVSPRDPSTKRQYFALFVLQTLQP